MKFRVGGQKPFQKAESYGDKIQLVYLTIFEKFYHSS
jgi:hypothetical protein